MDKLHRWVTQYLIHYNRIANEETDRRVWDEFGRRLALDVVDVDPEKTKLPDDLVHATDDDIKALDAVFEEWLCQTIGTEMAAKFERRYQPRFCDFLVVDEMSLRSLADLPGEVLSAEIVPLQQRLVSLSFLSALPGACWGLTKSTSRG
jgi:hypothetical protein